MTRHFDKIIIIIHVQGVLPSYELLHTTYIATHATLIFDSLPILIDEGAEVQRFEKYIAKTKMFFYPLSHIKLK